MLGKIIDPICTLSWPLTGTVSLLNTVRVTTSTRRGYIGDLQANGRDYFHNPSVVLAASRFQDTRGFWGSRPVGDCLSSVDESGMALLEESQVWTVRDGRTHLMDLLWSGKAHTEVTISEYNYGGLFVRMPWKTGNEGEVINSSRQRNSRAEGQRATWVDIGMEIEGRDDWGHIAIFDHPENATHPMPWRVDRQMGAGPARSRLGDWKIPAGGTKIFAIGLSFIPGVERC